MSGSHREIVREVYSEVLFDLAEQSAELDSVLEELAAVRGVLRGEPEFAALLASQMIKPAEKADIIRRVFEGRLSNLTVNFLCVLARRGRVGLLQGVSDRFETLVDAYHNRRVVEVTLAVKPDEAEIARLKAELSEALQSEVKLDVKVDPSIIGGVVIRKDDTLIDNSVRSALKVTVRSVMENMKANQGRQDENK